ncbi:MAG: AfsR/SARP family transcriptional regulator [Ardenticatenaceae bacterium]
MDESNITQLTLSLLGPFQVSLDGQLLNHFPTDKVRALLVYLAIEADRPLRRDTLAGLLWTEWPNRQARRNLRKSLYWLRQTLDNHRPGISEELFTITRQTVQFNEGTFILDISTFLRLLSEVESHAHGALHSCSACLDRLTRAVGLYKGEFLTGFSLADALTFEEWLLAKREEFQQQVLNTLANLAAAYEQRREFDLVQRYAGRQLVLEPWREEAHRQVMRSLASNGQRAEALAQYGTCRRILQDELGVEPTPETTSLYQEIRDGSFQKRIKAESARQENESFHNKGDNREGLRSSQENLQNVAVVRREGTNPKEAFRSSVNKVAESDPLYAPHAPTAAPVHHFPVQFTPFVGRQTELTQCMTYLTDPACRLLTLCGPGGMGKTRLSIQVGTQVASKLPTYDGIYFIGMAEISSLDFFIPTLANSLGVPLKGAISAQVQLIRYLQSKKILLVIDNFEQLSDAANLLMEILSAAPGVKMLVTSREPLNLRAEWRLILPGLAYPQGSTPKGETPAEADGETKQSGESGESGESEVEGIGSGDDLISSYSAVQLFVQTATHVQPGYSPTSDEQAVIVRICQLVGGMPLAIEIAAAWVRMYDCETIAQEIARNLDFMVSPLRDMPLRHRSMRAVYQHSWDLLSAAEQTALLEISVFRGGFNMKAASSVTSATVLELMGLLDKSLLRRTEGGRYEIHELLRKFAAEQLGEESAKVRDRHATYYTSFLEARTPDLKGGNQQKALREIDQELQNCNTAWEWAISQAHVAAIGTGLEGLFHFYDIRSRFEEGQFMFREAATKLAILPGNKIHAIVKAKLQARLGWFAFHLGQTEQSWSLLEKSLNSLRALHAERDMVFNLNYLGAVARHLGQYENTQRYLAEAWRIAGAVGDQLGASVALNILGQVASLQGKYEAARRLCRQSLQIKRTLGERWGMTFSLTYLGRVELMLGEYQEAKELFHESMTISEAFGDRRGMAFSLQNLGNVAYAQGDSQLLEAQRLYQESLHLYNEIGNRQDASLTLTKLANVACDLEESESAKSHFKEALSIALEIGSAPAMLAGLLGTARLYTRLNSPQRALPLLTFIQNNPSSSPAQQAEAQQLQTQITPPDPEQTTTTPANQETTLAAFVESVLRTHFEVIPSIPLDDPFAAFFNDSLMQA